MVAGTEVAGVLAAMNLVDLLRSFGNWDWLGWALRAIPRVRLSGLDRQQRLVDPAGSWDRLANLPAGRALLSAARATEHEFQDAVASVLHLHANRLIGLDRSREDQALAIVRERVHSASVHSGQWCSTGYG